MDSRHHFTELQTALAGRYEILEEAGQGASASVFKAEDLKHGRRVALKVLHPELARAVGPDRFLREIELAAGLQHPHILPLYDSGVAGSLFYFVTPMVEGGSLRDRLARESELPLDEALRIAAEVADGLAFAHARGIVHRDVKPENILLSSGHALVADFGIARVLTCDSMATLTATGFAVGTPAYMSPEQAAGVGRVDARADLYSLGCVLFEMLAGRPPFLAPTAESVIRQHIAVPPPDLRVLRPSIGDGLARLVNELLAKNPVDRPTDASTARDALQSLRYGLASGTTPVVAGPALDAAQRTRSRRPARIVRLIAFAGSALAVLSLGGIIVFRSRTQTGCSSPAVIRSLAVLPLRNLSGDASQEYFADGMTEELIGSLAAIRSLRVISRTSAMTYKGVSKPVPRIARELGVDAVVGGSASREGSLVRVRVELIQARPERSLWSGRFDRSFVNILGLETELASSIAREVKARLTPEEQARVSAVPQIRPEAHEAYLRGRFALGRLDLNGYRSAIEEFKKALAIDPSDARAWVGLANAYYYMSNVYLSPSEAIPSSRQAAEQALALDPNLAGAHSALGVLLSQYDWKWSEAESKFRRAIELSPNDASAHLFYATLLTETGRFDEAIREYEISRSLDPLSYYVATVWIQPEYITGKYDRVVQRMTALAESDSSYGPTYVLRGLCHLGAGRIDEAIADLERAARRTDNAYAIAVLGHAYGRAGRVSEARRALATLQDRSQSEHVSAYSFAIVHLGLGERDQAFAWLERAFRNRDEDLAPIRVDPLLAPLRGDVRYQSLLSRMNLAG